MNNTINTPVTADIVIQKLQTYLFDNLGWSPIEVYGRVYKNKIDSGTVPQSYKGEGDYVPDVFFTDKGQNKGNIFFILDDKHKSINVKDMKVQTKIVFMLNLKLIFNDDSQRQDAKAQQEAWNLIKKKNQFTLKGIETGMETVLKGFNLSEIQKADIEPLHIFAIVGDLKYTINKC